MAAIQPFYSRAHCLGEQKNNKLTFALRAAINTLQLLSGCRPRTFPWTTGATATEAVIYSDAFFQIGDRNMKAHGASELWSPQKRKPTEEEAHEQRLEICSENAAQDSVRRRSAS